MKGILKILGRLGRGSATKLGAVLVGGGATLAAGGPAVTASFALDPSITQAIEALIQLVSAISVLVGTIVAAFGIGRKAAAAAADGDDA
jgi:hypothetical protein